MQISRPCRSRDRTCRRCRTLCDASCVRMSALLRRPQWLLPRPLQLLAQFLPVHLLVLLVLQPLPRLMLSGQQMPPAVLQAHREGAAPRFALRPLLQLLLLLLLRLQLLLLLPGLLQV